MENISAEVPPAAGIEPQAPAIERDKTAGPQRYVDRSGRDVAGKCRVLADRAPNLAVQGDVSRLRTRG